jgi:Skp family chaperone for outer membrane proteins
MNGCVMKYRTVLLRVLVSIFIFLPPIAALGADPDDTVTVQAVGYGANKDEATRDALSSALQSVVGSYIVTETKYRNSLLVMDRVDKHSRGTITDYKVISVEEADNLLTVTLDVYVKKSDLVNIVQELFETPASSSISIDNLGGILQEKLKADKKALEEGEQQRIQQEEKRKKAAEKKGKVDRFNKENVEEFAEQFKAIYNDPIINNDVYSVVLTGVNVFFIDEYEYSYQDSEHKFALETVKKKKKQLSFGFGRRADSDVFEDNIGVRTTVKDDYYLYEITYSYQLNMGFLKTLRDFFEYTAEKVEKGRPVSYGPTEVIVTDAVHLKDRGIYSWAFTFDQKHSKAMRAKLSGLGLFLPELEFSLNDKDGFPVRRWKQKILFNGLGTDIHSDLQNRIFPTHDEAKVRPTTKLSAEICRQSQYPLICGVPTSTSVSKFIHQVDNYFWKRFNHPLANIYDGNPQHGPVGGSSLIFIDGLTPEYKTYLLINKEDAPLVTGVTARLDLHATSSTTSPFLSSDY